MGKIKIFMFLFHCLQNYSQNIKIKKPTQMLFNLIENLSDDLSGF